MMTKRQRLKYLTESVLIAERGIPFANTMIILVVTAIIAAFIFWAGNMPMEDKVTLDGLVAMEGGDLRFIGVGEAGHLVGIRTGANAYIAIDGLTTRQDIRGEVVSEIGKRELSSTETLFYVVVKADDNDRIYDQVKGGIIEGMSIEMNVVTGKRTLLQYLLGNFYDTSRSISE